MTGYRVVPLEEEIAWRVRANLRAPDFGDPAYVRVARGGGPCRVCLRGFDVGTERQILFTYDPFRRREPFPLPGPILIHEHGCTPYGERRVPTALAELPVTLDGYAAGCELVARARVYGSGAVEEAGARLFDRPRVSYVHVRSTSAGAFVCELSRV